MKTLFLVLFLSTVGLGGGAALGQARATEPGAIHSAVPFSQIGALAGRQYTGDGLALFPIPGGAGLRCVFQKLDGEVTREGLWLTSTADGAPGDKFRVVASSIRRLAAPGSENAAPAPVPSLDVAGKVMLTGQRACFLRPGLVEEFTVGLDGIRQDFIIEQRPIGTGTLRVALDVTGARVEPLPEGVRLVLHGSGRKLNYHRLHVTDATGRELTARMEAEAETGRRSVPAAAIAIIVDDIGASYPIRIDPTFSDANWLSLGGVPGVDGMVDAATVDGSGNLYAGGMFAVAGNGFAANIAKWNGTNWSALGAGMDGPVTAIAVSGSNLYAGGNFTNAGGSPANYIARWNGTSWTALGSGMDAPVNALAVSGTNLYVGGNFRNAGGSAANYIARWNGTSWSTLGPGATNGMDAPVAALAVIGNDVFAGGVFNAAGGNPANFVARWNTTAASWSALGSGVDGPVSALAASGTNLFIGGSFANAGGGGAFNIAKWDGTAWSALGTGVDGPVNALVVSGTDLYAGGLFTLAGGAMVNYIARWHFNDSSWNALGSGMDGVPSALALFNGNLYAGGFFFKAGGQGVDNIAQFDGTVWSSLGASGSGLNNVVNAMAVSGTNVYVGGAFTAAGGVPANRVAKWNGSSWSGLGSGFGAEVYALAVSPSGDLYAGGIFQTTDGSPANYLARWDGTTWHPLGTEVDGTVQALAFLGTDLYAAGLFSKAGSTTVNYVAKWSTTLNSWSALGTGLNNGANSLAVSGNSVYVGGVFSMANGSSANSIAQWNTSGGGSWNPLGSVAVNGVNGQVLALAASGSTVYVAGGFTAAGGIPANDVAAWNGATGWSALGGGLNGVVTALAATGNDLYAGGGFSTAGGSPAMFIAYWNGTNWAALGSGANQEIQALTIGNGNLYIGGYLTAGGGKPSSFAAAVQLGSGPTLAVPSSFTITEDLSGNLLFTGTPFADGNGSATLTVTLSILDGTITASTSGGVTVSGTSTARTFSGSITALNTYFTTAGKITYTPAQDNTTARTLTTLVSDGSASASGASTVSITPVNDAPSGANNTVTTLEDAAYTFAVADFGFSDPNDAPANNLLAVKITTLPVNGKLTNNNAAVTLGQFVAVADITGNKLKYTPAPNGAGNAYASFTFQVQDDGGTANSGVNLDPTPRTVTINVTAVNDPPAGANNTVTTLEDAAYTFAVADFGFSDPNDAPANNLLAVKITTLPVNGKLTNNNAAVTLGQFVAVADITGNKLKYTPAPNGAGNAYASFTFQVQDDGGTGNSGINLDPTPRTMTINVTAPANTQLTLGLTAPITLALSGNMVSISTSSNAAFDVSLDSTLVTNTPLVQKVSGRFIDNVALIFGEPPVMKKTYLLACDASAAIENIWGGDPWYTFDSDIRTAALHATGQTGGVFNVEMFNNVIATQGVTSVPSKLTNGVQSQAWNSSYPLLFRILSPASPGAQFFASNGFHTISVTATDSAGKMTTGQSAFVLPSTNNPDLIAPITGTVTLTATNVIGASTNGIIATAYDPAGITSITYSVGSAVGPQNYTSPGGAGSHDITPIQFALPSNVVFPIGDTAVTVTTTNGAGQTKTKSFTVTVLSPLTVSTSDSNPRTLNNIDLINTTSGTLTLAGSTTIIGNTALRGGPMIFTGGFTVSSGATLKVETSINVCGGMITIPSGSELVKTGPGTLTLEENANFHGNIVVMEGTIDVKGCNVSTSFLVENAAALKGTGTVASVTLDPGGTIQPGASPGTLASSNTIWQQRGNYEWEINNATGTAGADPGWDSLNITGTLSISATAQNKFNILLKTLTLANAPGAMANFNNSTVYSWRIASASGGITGFDPSVIRLDTNGVTNALGGGAFTLTKPNANDLMLSFIPTSQNTAPTDITLDNATIADNSAASSSVGLLTAADANATDNHTFTLVNGTGGADNNSFIIDGNAVRPVTLIHYATQNTYHIRVRATDAGGLYFEKPFTITVTNPVTPPNFRAANSTFVSSQFQVRLNGDIGKTYLLLFSTNLSTWTPMATRTIPGAGYLDFIDTGSSGSPRRFYRMILMP